MIDDEESESDFDPVFDLVGGLQPENPPDSYSAQQITGKARWEAEKERQAANTAPEDDGFVIAGDDIVDISEDGSDAGGKFGNKKLSFDETNEIVDIQDNSMDTFVILEEKGKTMWLVKSVLKYSAFVAVFLIGIFITYMLMMYRFVPEKLLGAEWTVGHWSCIAKDYQLPVDELKPGDIIVSVKGPDFSPLVWNYGLYDFHSAQGEMFTVTSLDTGLQDRIEQGDVAYVVDGTPYRYDTSKYDQ